MKITYCDRCGRRIEEEEGTGHIQIHIFTMNRNILYGEFCYPCTGDLVMLLKDFSPVFNKEIR